MEDWATSSRRVMISQKAEQCRNRLRRICNGLAACPSWATVAVTARRLGLLDQDPRCQMALRGKENERASVEVSSR